MIVKSAANAVPNETRPHYNGRARTNAEKLINYLIMSAPFTACMTVNSNPINS